jgi:hypothetical protein
LCHESKLLPAWYKKVTYVDTSFSKLKKSLLETILDFFIKQWKKNMLLSKIRYLRYVTKLNNLNSTSTKRTVYQSLFWEKYGQFFFRILKKYFYGHEKHFMDTIVPKNSRFHPGEVGVFQNLYNFFKWKLWSNRWWPLLAFLCRLWSSNFIVNIPINWARVSRSKSF